MTEQGDIHQSQDLAVTASLKLGYAFPSDKDVETSLIVPGTDSVVNSRLHPTIVGENRSKHDKRNETDAQTTNCMIMNHAYNPQ